MDTRAEQSRHDDRRQEEGVVQNRVELRRSPSEVFDYCIDLRNELEWNPSAESVSMLTPEPLQAGSRLRAKWKGGPTSIVEIVEYERPHRWVSISEASIMRIRFEGRVTPTDTGSRLDSRMEIEGRGIGRLLGPVYVWLFRRDSPKTMANIKRALEARAET